MDARGCTDAARCKTVPIEKGTETLQPHRDDAADLVRCKTIPIEKGTETRALVFVPGIAQKMQDHPHREGD